MFRVPFIDPEGARHRRRLVMGDRPRDLASRTMRLALHLTDSEHAALEAFNPDTLGRHDDERLRSQYWRQFIESSASAPFRVNKV